MFTILQVQSKLSLLAENVTPQVAALTEVIWREALGEVDAVLEVPINLLKAKQVLKAFQIKF